MGNGLRSAKIGLLEYKGNHAEYRGWIRDLWKQEFPMKSWRKPEVFITGTNLRGVSKQSSWRVQFDYRPAVLDHTRRFRCGSNADGCAIQATSGGDLHERRGKKKAQMLPYCCVSAEPTPVYLIASQGSPAKVIATGGSLLWRMTLKILHAKPSNPA